MTLRRFLDAAYAVLVEDFVRMGVPLFTALEQLERWAARPPGTPEKVPEVIEASQNDQAIAALQARMSGVQGKPKLA